MPDTLLIIAGNGRYPFQLAEAARRRGVKRLCAAAFENETDPALAGWMPAATGGKPGATEVPDLWRYAAGVAGALMVLAIGKAMAARRSSDPPAHA